VALIGAQQAEATNDTRRPVLAMRGVTVQIGKATVLQDLTFDVLPGEVVGLLGANGSGKSTALRVACGLLAPQSGHVRTGRDGGRPDTAAGRRAFSMIFQSPSVDPVLTVRENLDFAARALGLQGSARTDAVGRAVQAARLVEQADARVRTLSGGMRRRVDLARVLLRPTEVVLLDEPSSGLDETSFRAFWNDLLAVRAEHGTALLVATHRPDEAQLCDRLIVLQRGVVVREATPEALIAEIEEDRIVLTTRAPLSAEALAAIAALGLGVEPNGEAQVTLRGTDGAGRLPRVMEIVDPEAVVSVSLHRPTLADAFARLTAETVEAG
jgi:ABC-2 type transport system ATP-binding protein